MRKTFLILLTAAVGCSRADQESIMLARAVQPCIERANAGAPVSIPVRIALADDGSVVLIEVKGRNGDQALYDAEDAVMRAVQKCSPYHLGQTGEFEIVVTY